MTNENLPWDEYVDMSAKLLGFPMEPAWKKAASANIETLFRMAALLEGFQLPDDIEPAPVFKA